MTRDQVIEEVLEVLSREGFGPRGEVQHAVRALKSKPPEESPEVEDRTSRAAWAEVNRLGERLCAANLELVTTTLERDALRAEVARLTWLQSGAPMPGETPRSE